MSDSFVAHLIQEPVLMLMAVLSVIAFTVMAFVTRFFLKNLRQQKKVATQSSPLESGLSKTQSGFSQFWSKLRGQETLSSALRDELEETLITADFGVATTQALLDGMRDGISADEVRSLLRERIEQSFPKNTVHVAPAKPRIVMIVGVNGAGKTTTIGKLALQFKKLGNNVLLGAGDTFRAAAGAQLNVWAERAGVPCISRAEGSDPASVLFDTLTAAQARSVDIALCDTAGRLHTKQGLMEELKKCTRVMQKVIPQSPHDKWLVLDATTGQNGRAQAKEFHEALGLTGIILTKLDSTAKGGVVVSIARELGIPIVFVGVGEKIDDLLPFDPKAFAAALLPLAPPERSS